MKYFRVIIGLIFICFYLLCQAGRLMPITDNSAPVRIVENKLQLYIIIRDENGLLRTEFFPFKLKHGSGFKQDFNDIKIVSIGGNFE